MWVERDGVRINYSLIGDGPTVILHTGGAGDGAMWQEHLPYLRDFRLVLIDHRGRGASSQPTTLSGHAMIEYVSDVVAVVAELAVRRVGFVGYSMGAHIGYELAATRPDLIASLVGLGVTREIVPQPDEDVALAALVREHGMVALVNLVEEEERIALPEWLTQQFLDTNAEQFALSLEALKDWSVWPCFARIECPTLIVAGEAEDPPHLNAVAATKIALAQAVWLPGLGHVGAFLAAREQCQLIEPHLRSTLR
ncbi:MAG TPA: alpha/beta hydrolase [Actinomycetes bacterium]|nr:alpha/beta hydrolase [Actinomycetes bacterium]